MLLQSVSKSEKKNCNMSNIIVKYEKKNSNPLLVIKKCICRNGYI